MSDKKYSNLHPKELAKLEKIMTSDDYIKARLEISKRKSKTNPDSKYYNNGKKKLRSSPDDKYYKKKKKLIPSPDDKYYE